MGLDSVGANRCVSGGLDVDVGAHIAQKVKRRIIGHDLSALGLAEGAVGSEGGFVGGGKGPCSRATHRDRVDRFGEGGKGETRAIAARHEGQGFDGQMVCAIVLDLGHLTKVVADEFLSMGARSAGASSVVGWRSCVVSDVDGVIVGLTDGDVGSSGDKSTFDEPFDRELVCEERLGHTI